MISNELGVSVRIETAAYSRKERSTNTGRLESS